MEVLIVSCVVGMNLPVICKMVINNIEHKIYYMLNK